jgi:hypothetical protein
MRRGDRLPLTQSVFRYNIFALLLYIEYKMHHDAIILIYANLAQRLLEANEKLLERASDNDLLLCRKSTSNKTCYRQWFDRCIISKMILKSGSNWLRYIRKMRRGDRLPLTQSVFRYNIFVLLLYIEYKMQHDAIILIYANLAQTGLDEKNSGTI